MWSRSVPSLRLCCSLADSACVAVQVSEMGELPGPPRSFFLVDRGVFSVP